MEYWNRVNGVDVTPGLSWHYLRALLASWGPGRAWRRGKVLEFTQASLTLTIAVSS